jgi:hypothetical protein
MNTKSRLLLPLAASLAALQGCTTVGQTCEDMQPAARVDTAMPVATRAPDAAPVAVPKAAMPATKVATSDAPIATAAKPEAASAPAATAGDRYTVLPGDTLAGIAAKPAVYGDARLWQLLYRDNVQLIGPRGLIFPNQVLNVGRNHTADEIKALITPVKRVVPAAVQVAKTPAVAQPAPGTIPAAEAKAAEVKPVEAKPAEAVAAQVKAPAASVAATPHAAPPAGEAPKGAPTVGGQVGKLSEYLNAGRRAFEAGDTPWATYYYSTYLEQKNDDANAWGELGNIHYLDGNLADAAKCYYNAANLLIDRGQTARAMELIPAIDEGDPGLSEALHQRLVTIRR